MRTRRDGALLREFGTLFNLGVIRKLTDGQLLERFSTAPGETAELAFAALVERHGSMVMRVCLALLPEPHDATDAFQATFLILIKKARGLWVSDSLGPWLHQVALRTASCARLAAARRQKHERAAAIPAQASRVEGHDDLGPVLHEEIDRLPERFRVSVVLRDLEGRTHEQAARHLGWPVGTVKSRLTRARQRLRDRLVRRGLSPTAGVLAALRPGGLEELLPGSLVSSTTGAALRFAASRTILGGSTAILAQGVLTAMSMTRWWKAASLLLVAGATVSGVTLMARGSGPGGGLQVQTTAKAGPGSGRQVAPANLGKFRISTQGRGVLEVERT